MIRIETERLILRPFSDGDLSALFMLLSDEEVTAFLPMFPLKDMAEGSVLPPVYRDVDSKRRFLLCDLPER